MQVGEQIERQENGQVGREGKQIERKVDRKVGRQLGK